jgi:hypothetical protein
MSGKPGVPVSALPEDRRANRKSTIEHARFVFSLTAETDWNMGREKCCVKEY